MRLLYLGELIMDSYVTWCLEQSGQFDIVHHFTKPTLQFGHINVNPLPDKILLKCDYEGEELEWARRYSLEIPKIFISCYQCEHKIPIYEKFGEIFHIDKALVNHDFLLKELITLVKGEDYNENV